LPPSCKKCGQRWRQPDSAQAAPRAMHAVELFAGAGGLALGCGMAGFAHLAVVERDPHACHTVRENQRRAFAPVAHWNIQESDVRDFDFCGIMPGIDLLAAGPPCQPFSLGGKHRAYHDARDMFPATVEAIRRLQPKAFIIENVKGLTRERFANYFHYIQLQLEYPQITIRKYEDWLAHFERLQKEKTAGNHKELTYKVTYNLVNAADYGAPQKRERIFIVGFRSDIAAHWSFPPPTHSRQALLHDQWVTGCYWQRHNMPAPVLPAVRQAELALHHRQTPALLPWRTVRDAIGDLPDPETGTLPDIANHIFQPGARAYPGHTGSPLDQPAKALKAGAHGVPGGENMLVRDDGSARYFTVRESARLQTFPDGFVFAGSWTETMRQLGNAVPVVLARRVAASVAEQLLLHEMAQTGRIAAAGQNRERHAG